jgi:lysophospholipase L1-like esterase/mannose-6-phosphate isomerase-like protein (cupin superfamily)
MQLLAYHFIETREGCENARTRLDRKRPGMPWHQPEGTAVVRGGSGMVHHRNRPERLEAGRMKKLEKLNTKAVIGILAKGLPALFLAAALVTEGVPDELDLVTVHLAGDSTMAEKRPEKRPETGWGEALQDWFDPSRVRVVNHAMNGRSTRTFLEEGRWQQLLDALQPGDFAFIQFGHNDQSSNRPNRYTPPDRFKANLARFVRETRARQATPVLLTPVMRRRFDDDGVFYDTHGEYPDLVRAVAAELDAPLIDMHRASEEVLKLYGAGPSRDLFLILPPGRSGNYPDGLEDNTHFSPMGARVMAALVAARLSGMDIGLRPIDKPSGHRIEHEAEIGRPQSAPHKGGGETTAYPFFGDIADLGLVFRKRALHPGSAIGYHLHDKDEIYYVLSGTGELTMNGATSTVGPGTAILTRPGDSHGLRPVGEEDLVIFIVYGREVE